MTVAYIVTFEFDTQPPLTYRGTVSASGMPTCVARAARAAKLQAGRQAWRSVVVHIERLSSPRTSEPSPLATPVDNPL
jgi:hypothetical protein